jgi:fumarylacetoacetase
MIAANNPALKSWVAVPENSDFSIQNLPFGIFKTANLTPRVGVRIGDSVLDLKTLFLKFIDPVMLSIFLFFSFFKIFRSL